MPYRYTAPHHAYKILVWSRIAVQSLTRRCRGRFGDEVRGLLAGPFPIS
jgi:hypothetical protein